MYNGYLVMVGSSKIPTEYIAEESYYATIWQRQDLDSYRDNTGKLHRDVVANKPSKIEFKTIDGLTNEQIVEITNIFEKNFTVYSERKALISFYDPSHDCYFEEYMYLKDPKYQIDYIDKDSDTVYYKSVQYILTGY